MYSMQALPLMTVIVGKQTNSGTCRAVTLSENVDKPFRVEFQVPTPDNPLKPGIPSWANYVKGVVANFPGEFIAFMADQLLFCLWIKERKKKTKIGCYFHTYRIC